MMSLDAFSCLAGWIGGATMATALAMVVTARRLLRRSAADARWRAKKAAARERLAIRPSAEV